MKNQDRTPLLDVLLARAKRGATSFHTPGDKNGQALHQFPEAKAVFVTSPTYHGVTTDLKKIALLCHAHGKLLLVDEAHGAHLKFHKDLPISAVEAGADMCVQSTHKILSALSQGSVLHVNSKLVDINRVRKILSILQTTSPNYLILASLDAARRQVFFQGKKIFTRLMRLAEDARERINRLQHVYCLTQGEIRAKGYDLDVTKLTVNVTRMS